MLIYEPAEDSFLLQKYVREYALGRVLEIGTGSGIQALTAITSPKVREVIAVDIDEEAVKSLQEKIQKEKLRKIKVLQSDLFSQVTGQFNLIIFNPPYLPQDKGIEDKTIYGGKKGWELSEKFFQQVSPHLLPDGKILLLFSSLTNKKKIEEILNHYLLEGKEIGRQKIAFEELFVYEVQKSKLLRELESKSITQIHYFAQGKRGTVFVGDFELNAKIKTHLVRKKEFIKVAVKVKRKESSVLSKMENESSWLKTLNQEGIGPRLLFSGENYLVYEFVEGVSFREWLPQAEKKELQRVLISLLQQCFRLDQLQVDKQEMHHPWKHILIEKNNSACLIDFERGKQTIHPKNLTQFIEFLSRIQKELQKKGISFEPETFRFLAKEYKESLKESLLSEREKIFKRIINQVSS